MEFLKLAEERYSCRSLSERPVEPEKIDAILRAAVLAPTACNYQPFKVWVMTAPEALAAVKSVCTQPFIQPAPAVFVVGAEEQRAWVRDYDGKNFADVDAAIAATHMMLEVHDLGLGTTWIGHFDPKAIAEQFPDMQGYSLIAMFAVGYPADNAVPGNAHSRFRPDGELIRRYE